VPPGPASEDAGVRASTAARVAIVVVRAKVTCRGQSSDHSYGFSFGGYGSDSPDRTELTRKALERGGVAAVASLREGLPLS
jgi:hypothetical protein